MPALPVFTPEQHRSAQRLLAHRVAQMMGRKLEEADWTDVYRAALGYEEGGWSNLEIDVMHGNLGVEQKMLRYTGESIVDACGRTFMHPSLTRQIRISSAESDPNEAMRHVFGEYDALVERRRNEVRVQNDGDSEVELRSGWLLWQQSLRQFLYFEEPMTAPRAEDYVAEWHAGVSKGGRRRASKNLWIYERETGRKRYSVTTDAGAKIQPYFDVPPADDPNVYVFTVIGEEAEGDHVRTWLTRRTAAQLQAVVGSLDADALEGAARTALERLRDRSVEDISEEVDEVQPVLLPGETYRALSRELPALNDDHLMQLMIDALS